MGQILFWLEAAAAAVLLAALRTAVNCRIARWRWLVGLAYIVVMSLFWLATAGITIVAHAFARTVSLPLIGAILGLSGFLAGSIVVRIRGRRKQPDEPTRRAAADWPAARLAWAALAAAILTGMTFWNLDLAARQEMAIVRAEACMTAMSVTPPRVVDSENAALLYRRAAELMKSEPAWKDLAYGWAKPKSGVFNPIDEKMLAFLARHADSLELLRQGSDLPGYDDGLQLNPPDGNTRLPELDAFMALGECLEISAKANAHAGRLVEAARDVTAYFGMARHKAAESLLMSEMVAMRAEYHAWEAFQDMLEADPVPREAVDALRIDPRTAFQPALQNAVAIEECFGLVAFSQPEQTAGVFAHRLPDEQPTLGKPRAFGQSPLYRVFLWREDLAAYRDGMDRLRLLAGRPYHESADAWKRLGEGQGVSGSMGGRMAGLFTAAVASSTTQAAWADAQHRLALLAIAACRYHNARGAWPENLATLVPAYLPAVPIDPFTGKPLLLARTPNGRPILYSVGPDIVDDGGKPFDRKTDTGDIRLVLPPK